MEFQLRQFGSFLRWSFWSPQFHFCIGTSDGPVDGVEISDLPTEQLVNERASATIVAKIRVLFDLKINSLLGSNYSELDSRRRKYSL